MKHLFRAKRVDNGEWVEGYYIEDIENNKAYIFDKNYASIKSGMFSCYYEVISESVGMWTGLNDKNGKKIFEGDIVIADDFSNGCCTNQLKIKTIIKFVNCGYQLNGRGYNPDFSTCEIIGNITDNPEMAGNK
jgi:uncharacterized phage protein (TIGR01671 family)